MDQNCICWTKKKYFEDGHNPNGLHGVEGESVDDTIYTLESQEKAVRLPGMIQIDESVSEYPNAQSMNIPHLFQEMSEIISGVEDYKSNILSFWILDVFIEGLRAAQMSEMNHRNQRATLLWMAYMYNVIQGTARKISRKEVLLKMNMILLNPGDSKPESDMNSDTVDDGSEETNAKSIWTVPLPPPLWGDAEVSFHQNWIGESHSQLRGSEMDVSTKVEMENDVNDEKDNKDEDAERNVTDTVLILDIVYKIYARLWAFVQVQTSVRLTPVRKTLDLPYKLNVPKSALRLETSSQAKSDKGGRKSTISQKLVEDGSILNKEQSKGDQLFPLMMAQDVESFLRELFLLPSHESSVKSDRGKSEKKKK